ncbi:MAG: YraN family protein [Planctomycetes bacterium]|nr:YraN family protein [Planctomycetota bacterium]
MWPFRQAESVGRRGENLAARTLQGAGCKILARNYRCPAGEADLVALTGQTLVFTEVKTRSCDAYVDPESAVDTRKRDRYRKVARYYLHQTGRADLAVRFDVVSIVIRPGQKAQIRHIPDAFT